MTKVLPFIHNTKYSRTSIYLLEILVEQHPEQALWKAEVSSHIQEELSTIAELTKLDGLLELAEHNFG